MSGHTVAVIGGGSWATALVKLLLENGQDIRWWMRNPKTTEYVARFGHNPHYLSSVSLPVKPGQVSSDLNYCLDGSSHVLLAVPSAFLPEVLEKIPDTSYNSTVWISAVKGILLKEKAIVGEWLHKKKGVSLEQVVIISGPCHAEEVALERLSYLTIASEGKATREEFARKLDCRYLRTVLSDDIYGTEWGAVLKNIYALCGGICHGLGYGDNFLAVLIANAIREMKRFVDAVHPINRDINESAYLGDLLVTAYSPFSRNRSFGTWIGKGYSVKQTMAEMNMVAEGYYASSVVTEIAQQYEVDMPIASAVHAILYQNKPAASQIRELSTLLT